MCGFALTAPCMVHVGSITAAVSAEIDTLQVALTLLLLLHTHTPLSIWLAARRHVFPQRKSGRQRRDANTYQKHSHLHLRGRRLATAEERVSARLSHRASCLAPLRFARTAAAGSTDQPVRESLRPGGVKEDGPTDGWTAGCVLLSPYPPVRYASLRFRCPLLPPLSSSDSARGLVGTR